MTGASSCKQMTSTYNIDKYNTLLAIWFYNMILLTFFSSLFIVKMQYIIHIIHKTHEIYLNQLLISKTSGQ